MVRAEDGTEFTNLGQARTSECRECGGRLDFKGELETDHCNTHYVIVQSPAATMSATVKPAEEQGKEGGTTTAKAAPAATATTTGAKAKK